MAGFDVSGFFKGVNIGNLIDKIYAFFGIFLLLVVLGGVVTALIIVKRKQKKSSTQAKVGWWEEVGGTLVPTKMDQVEEIIIPGTILRIFYCKKRNLWLPRFTRGVTTDLYYVVLTPTRQMVNFTIPSLSKDLKRANLAYDHTDMLWAAENSREYIKTHYQDKSTKWWQLYQKEIAIAILILVQTFSFILIIYFMRGIIKDLSGIVSQIGEITKDACLRSQTSGIIAG